MQVFIILDQIKPPGIIFLMVCLSIWQHIAALDRYPAFMRKMLLQKIKSNKSFQVNPQVNVFLFFLFGNSYSTLGLPIKKKFVFPYKSNRHSTQTWRMAKQCHRHTVKHDRWHTSCLDLYVISHYHNRRPESGETMSVSALGRQKQRQ